MGTRADVESDDELEEWVARDDGSFVQTREPRRTPPLPPSRVRRSRLLTCGRGLAVALLAYSGSGLGYRLIRMMTAGPGCKVDGQRRVVRIGLLGAAKIAPFGLLHPARRLSCDVRVVSVGARDVARAARLARKWDIPNHGDYSHVISSTDVDAVYIPLINGLHYRWAAAALKAGKHVLIEKPITSNADEARKLARIAASRRLVLAEAYHWQHHPIAARLREIVRSGEIGAPIHLEVTAGLPTPDAIGAAIKSWLGVRRVGGSPRAKMDVELGGGNFMGQGCYTVSMARYLLGEPLRVLNATAVEDTPGSRADVATEATLLFPKGVHATVRSSALSLGFNVHLKSTRGSIKLTNYLFPHIYHSLSVMPDGGPKRVEKLYGDGAPTFELQLAAFARAIRREEPFPIMPADAIANMRWIDAIYDATGLGRRPGTSS